MTYKWKAGSYISNISAETAGKICEELSNNDSLTASKLVEVSRPEDAPLHSAFEWDNDIAAERYREQQARHIINCIVLSEEDHEKEPVRAFFNIRSTGNEYKQLNVLIRDKETREELLQQAKSELKAFRAKYSQLEELAGIMDEIDKAVS